MDEKNGPPFLRVVRTEAKAAPVKRDDFRAAPWQKTLFAGPLPNLLLFINFDAVSESDFLTAILNSRPRYVLDLRPVPRFDLGALNRAVVFSILEQLGTQYYDVGGKLGIKSPRDANLNPDVLVPWLKTVIFEEASKIEGPIVIILGSHLAAAQYEIAFSKALSQYSDLGWEILQVPYSPTRQLGPLKQTIFISHANPEDNDFALWLAAQLSLLGYRVWTDLTSLMGGEKFWDTIESVIKNDAVKVVVCLSKAAQSKEGVLDEIACAIGVERSQGLGNFVVPLRLDGLAFADVRANIGRKNIIDFSKGWGVGLSEIIKSFEHDRVPRPGDGKPESAALMSRIRRQSPSTLLVEPEALYANWLECLSFPDRITFLEFEGTVSDPNIVRQGLAYPTFAYLRLIGGFIDADEAQCSLSSVVRVSTRCKVDLTSFLKGQCADLPGLRAREARNYLTSLMREAWNRRASSMGLLPFQTARRSIAWYPPATLIPQDTVLFVGPEGVRRRKQLVGRSEKRGVFWHFAVEALPTLTAPAHFTLRPHVIFSKDGRRPIESDKRMHSLRRSFCRSWWNDRWRDLTAAYANWFGGNDERFSLAMSDVQSVVVATRLTEFRSPVRLAEHGRTTFPAELDLGDADWLDDPDIEEDELDDGVDEDLIERSSDDEL